MRARPVLHRNDPQKDPLTGHIKVTRADWLNTARDVLVTEGVSEVKVMSMARRMGVSRSSFYWYFKDRGDLLTALLTEWEERNTAQIVTQCELPSASITEALCNFFRCFVDPAKFDQGLDFAIREWSRRDDTVRARVDQADQARLTAITILFSRQGYGAADADARARILYFMQLGYHALEVREDMPTRLSRLAPYIRGFSGKSPDQAVIEAFIRDVEAMQD